MRVKPVVLIAAMLALVSPVAASAQTCVDIYYSCLNESWATRGLARILADLECGARYAGCIRNTVR